MDSLYLNNLSLGLGACLSICLPYYLLNIVLLTSLIINNNLSCQFYGPMTIKIMLIVSFIMVPWFKVCCNLMFFYIIVSYLLYLVQKKTSTGSSYIMVYFCNCLKEECTVKTVKLTNVIFLLRRHRWKFNPNYKQLKIQLNYNSTSTWKIY